MKIKEIIAICIIGLTAQRINCQTLPYPPSNYFEGVSWDTTSIKQFGQGSDQWPMTWAADGNMYAAWGDGWGWNADKEAMDKKSIGISRIKGAWGDLAAEDLWGEGPGSQFGKPEALIAFENKIYMFWTSGDSKYEHDSYAAVSEDSGKNWHLIHKKVFWYAPSGFRVRGIAQYGKDYQDAKDDYLYIYFGMNRHPDIFLARVQKEKIFDGLAYEWFRYRKPDGSARWTRDFSHKAVVFQDNNAYAWHLSIVYHPKYDKIILAKPHFDKDDDPDQIRIYETGINGLGIFDAPTPWGPWTSVYYNDSFYDGLIKFNYVIPAKFLNKESDSFILGWSGWPEYDNITFIKGKFIINVEKN
ncbi:MAG: hypothetical protein ACNS62_22190 [Candidatus Cyclobacteriaceae bacterium M3_2C_046]